MHGSIEVHSAEGKGTIFNIVLPVGGGGGVVGGFDLANTIIQEGFDENFEEETVNEDIIHDDRENATRILIVEDAPEVARLQMNQLNPDFNYYFAGNGREGLEKAKEIVPDLIITFNVGYKSVSFFKKDYGESLYRTVQSGESITLSKSMQTSWYVYLNASASYQKNVKGGLPKSISSGDSKLMTCDSNQSLYVDQYGRLSISTITIGTYTLKAAKDKTCTVTLNITN